MKIKIPSPRTDAGFKIGDTFGRVKLANSFLSLAENIEDDFTIMLDAKWGEGKTTFLKQFVSHAAEEGFPSIYLNAFEHDISKDAFSAISGQILALFHENEPKAEALKTRFLTSAAKLGKFALRASLRASLAVGTAGILNSKTIEEFETEFNGAEDVVDSLEDTLDAASAAAVENLIKESAEVQTNLTAVKSALSSVCDFLTDQPLLKGKNQNRRVFFVVDELDRCRPDFAIDIMEIIKHFFATERIIFVIGVDQLEILNSIRKVYGEMIDANRYLEKFYDIRFQFNQVTDSGREDLIGKYIDYIQTQLGEFASSASMNGCLKVIQIKSTHEGLSFRTVEKIVQKFLLVEAQLPSRDIAASPLLAFLCYSSVVDPGAYKKAVVGAYAWDEFHQSYSYLWKKKNNYEVENYLGCMQAVLSTGNQDSGFSSSALDWKKIIEQIRPKIGMSLAKHYSEKYLEVFSLSNSA